MIRQFCLIGKLETIFKLLGLDKLLMEIALWLGKLGIMCALVSGIEELGIRFRLQLWGKLGIRVKIGFLATEELVKLK